MATLNVNCRGQRRFLPSPTIFSNLSPRSHQASRTGGLITCPRRRRYAALEADGQLRKLYFWLGWSATPWISRPHRRSADLRLLYRARKEKLSVARFGILRGGQYEYFPWLQLASHLPLSLLGARPSAFVGLGTARVTRNSTITAWFVGFAVQLHFTYLALMKASQPQTSTSGSGLRRRDGFRHKR